MEKCNQEEAIKEIKSEFNDLCKKVENMPKIEYVLEQLLKSNEQFNESYKQQTEINQELKLTLTQLSFNIEALNIRQEKTDKKIVNVENMVKETDDKTKVDVAVMQKSSIENWLIKLFGIVGFSSILYFILERMGILQ